MNQIYIHILVLGAFAITRFVGATVFVEHERRHDTGAGLFKKHIVGDNHFIPIRVGLVQSNLNHGHDRLMDISDPYSSNFGRHYTVDEVTALFAPPAERVHAVTEWIKSNSGIEAENIRLSPNKQWLHFFAHASDLASMLNTTYYQYKDTETGVATIGCDRYNLPHHMVGLVDIVIPGVQHIKKSGFKPILNDNMVSFDSSEHNIASSIPRPRHRAIVQKRESPKSPEPCSRVVTPKCIRQLYNITDTVANVSGNTVGVFEFGSFARQSDMDKFYKKYAPKIPQGTFPAIRRIDGAPTEHDGVAALGVGDEVELDLQIIYPLVYPTEVQLFVVNDLYYENVGLYGKNKTYGLFNTFLDALDGSYCNFSAFGIKGDSPQYDQIYPDNHGNGPDYYKGQLQCGIFKPPPVISISYGETEANYSVNYQRRQCQEMMKLGLQGVTVLAASGDFGVSQSPHECKGPNHNAFQVSCMLNCPYVTGVGGTVFHKGTPGQDPEVGASFSGGGFSNVFPAPDYQNSSLNTFFEKYPPPYPYYRTQYQNNVTLSGRYNRAGRGIPDVSANADNIATIFDGENSPGGGTSASTPIWAGIVTRINAVRLAAGKSPIGFLNPTLYAHPEVFNDITSGNNPGCGTKGFTAVPGWDPVTGLGTPNYPRLKELLVGLP